MDAIDTDRLQTGLTYKQIVYSITDWFRATENVWEICCLNWVPSEKANHLSKETALEWSNSGVLWTISQTWTEWTKQKFEGSFPICEVATALDGWNWLECVEIHYKKWLRDSRDFMNFLEREIMGMCNTHYYFRLIRESYLLTRHWYTLLHLRGPFETLLTYLHGYLDGAPPQTLWTLSTYCWLDLVFLQSWGNLVSAFSARHRNVYLLKASRQLLCTLKYWLG